MMSLLAWGWETQFGCNFEALVSLCDLGFSLGCVIKYSNCGIFSLACLGRRRFQAGLAELLSVFFMHHAMPARAFDTEIKHPRFSV
jgi:hypothetical protein